MIEYQRNTAFVGFVLVVCFASFMHITGTVRLMLVPLVWSCFFALPLTGLIDVLEVVINQCASSCMEKTRTWRGGEAFSTLTELHFTTTSNSAEIFVSTDQSVDSVLCKVNHPCTSMLSGTPKWIQAMAFLCRRRVRLSRLVRVNHGEEPQPVTSPEVNRLVEQWLYYVSENPRPIIEGDTPRRLQLSLDAVGGYPAVMPLDPDEEPEELLQLEGTIEITKSNPISHILATLSSLILVGATMYLFGLLVYLAVNDFTSHLDYYADGIEDVGQWIENQFSEGIAQDALVWVKGHLQEALRNLVPEAARMVTNEAKDIMFQMVLFCIYLFFWVSEPLPLDANVSKVFKNYLAMKTLVCLLYGFLMSFLLWCLDCRLWHIFFVICFFLNYIPEVGAMLVSALIFPAVLFDGRIELHKRLWNVAKLFILGGIIKIGTGNILEVRVYAKRGGQFMRMHPVILVALMMLCSAILGVTGLFLSIPIMAALKYYILAADMPTSMLHPLLVLVEGDIAGPHKNFVDRRRAIQRGTPFPGEGRDPADRGDTTPAASPSPARGSIALFPGSPTSPPSARGVEMPLMQPMNVEG